MTIENLTREKIRLNKHIKITIILIFSCLLILLPSFLLLLATSWTGDDYLFAKQFQVNGLQGLYDKIFNWSPKFFCEIITYLYYNHAVPWLGKPFTGVMILITWLFLISSLFIFTQNTVIKNSLLLQNTKEHSAETKTKNKAEHIYLKILLPLLITLILFTYFLYCYPPREMYYVVVISVVYLSTLAGISFSLNFFINHANSTSISKSNMFQFILFSVITLSSYEMGMIYQLFFSSCLFLLLLLTSFSTKLSNYLPFSSLDKFNRWKLSIANLIPFSLSLYFLYLLKSARLTGIEGYSFASPLAGNFKASFIASLIQFCKELFFLDIPIMENTNTDFYFFSYSVVYKLGFLLLMTILFCQVKVRLNIITRNACFISIIPLFITNFITTFSGYYHLGTSTSARYMSFKLALIGLTIVIIALILASLFSSPKNYSNTKKININSVMNSWVTFLVSFCLTFTLLINLQFKYLKQDFLNLNNIMISNNQDWQRNLDSSQSFAQYTQIPTYYVFRMSFEPGLYYYTDKPELENYQEVALIDYFNKKKLSVVPFNR